MQKTYRLKKNSDFQSVYRRRRSFATGTTILYIKPNGRAYNRWGFSISKKVGNSVTRHRIKRLYREACLRQKENLKTGYDIVLVARKEAVALDFRQACCELITLFRRAKILTGAAQ